MDISNFYNWKWSISEPYYKSARAVKQEAASYINHHVENDSQQNAINHSLNDDIIDINNVNNRREILDNKMAGREPVLQRGANPFINQSTYVNDIVVRDMFLKPINTTQGRVKNNEEER
jgi:competence protein ComGF